MDKEQLTIQLEEALHVINQDIELVRRQAQRRNVAAVDLIDHMGRPKLRPLMESRVQAILALTLLGELGDPKPSVDQQDYLDITTPQLDTTYEAEETNYRGNPYTP